MSDKLKQAVERLEKLARGEWIVDDNRYEPGTGDDREVTDAIEDDQPAFDAGRVLTALADAETALKKIPPVDKTPEYSYGLSAAAANRVGEPPPQAGVRWRTPREIARAYFTKHAGPLPEPEESK